MTNASTRCSLVCTGGGTHKRREIALVESMPMSFQAAGFAVWDASQPPVAGVGETVGQTVRRTSAGRNQLTERQSVPTRIRRDGGRTYLLSCTFPGCNARRPRELRDKTIAAIIAIGASDCDLSALPG
jgi:hypothetical protein